MIRNGLYKIAYVAATQPAEEMGEVLAVVRRGRIFASDPYGGVYRGIDASSADAAGAVEATAYVPAGGELTMGLKGGETGVEAAIVGRVDPSADRQRAVIEIAGAPVEIDITFLGPLPN